MDSFAGKRVSVAGAGSSGLLSARLLLSHLAGPHLSVVGRLRLADGGGVGSQDPIEQVAPLHQVVTDRRELLAVCVEAAIALFYRRPWIAFLLLLGPGGGKGQGGNSEFRTL